LKDKNVTNIGIIGCGNISSAYFKGGQRFNNIEVVACADLMLDRAKSKAAEFGVPKALTVEQLLTDSDVEIVVNLTVPSVHAEVAIAALTSGKHVYGEKPLAVTREDGQSILDEAKKRGLRIGSAPDTFLGAGQQTCRKLIDDGEIGEPVAATGFMLGHGPESWHPDPRFFYAQGGGPLLDMGPYYLTALINLIGGIRRVSGSARASFAERKVTSEPRRGESVTVETPTHISGTYDFANGAIGTLVTSFDVWSHTHSNIEIYGTEGSLLVPDPNRFGGSVKVRRFDDTDWREVPYTHTHAAEGRGNGVADLAAAIRDNRPQRASGALAYHVLDVMLSTLESSDSGRHLVLSSEVDRPAALPVNLPEDSID
jgi:predicted dehydrogenase